MLTPKLECLPVPAPQTQGPMALPQRKRCTQKVCPHKLWGLCRLMIECLPWAWPIKASLRQNSKKENHHTTIDKGKGKSKRTVSALPLSWVAYTSCLFTTCLTSNFQLALWFNFTHFAIFSIISVHHPWCPFLHKPRPEPFGWWKWWVCLIWK